MQGVLSNKKKKCILNEENPKNYIIKDFKRCYRSYHQVSLKTYKYIKNINIKALSYILQM